MARRAAGMARIAGERVLIRWMLRRDVPEVMEIERWSFEWPWFQEDFVRCLRQRNCIGMVAEVEDRTAAAGARLAGYMVYELHKTRLHVLNFAVDRLSRRAGVGRQMVEKLQGKLSPGRRTRIDLEVRESNLAAQLFFRAQGFRAVTVLRGYYADTEDDAYLMQYRLDDAARTAEADARPKRKGGS